MIGLFVVLFYWKLKNYVCSDICKYIIEFSLDKTEVVILYRKRVVPEVTAPSKSWSLMLSNTHGYVDG